MIKVTPVTGADLSAISKPKKYGGTAETAFKQNAAMSVDLLMRITANSITYNLIRWIKTGPLETDGFWVVHPAADIVLNFAGAKAGRDWQRFTATDTPGEYAIWLVAGNVIDVADSWIDPCNRMS